MEQLRIAELRYFSRFRRKRVLARKKKVLSGGKVVSRLNRAQKISRSTFKYDPKKFAETFYQQYGKAMSVLANE
ncbi:hypothetical protein [Spirosoma agri]|uniref:hypothetical protein n=1 Tax=Spirosoma agri TaxID=1987381 RepID=UPI0013DA1E48|nr:hypothetical protein [Spirosoma agri]